MRTKALVPVIAWFVAVIVLAVTAQPRWFVIHAFTLGAVTTSIVYWSQYWTDKFMRQRSDAFRRCVVLNAFILLMFVGQAVEMVALLGVGAAGAVGVLVYHGWRLARQYRRGRRFSSSVVGYVIAAACFVVGAGAGVLLEWWPSDMVRGAHVAFTVLGFVGITALSTLALMLPMVWRTQMKSSRIEVAIALLTVGVVIVPLSAVGLVVYVAGWLWAAAGWVREITTVLRDPRDRVGYAALTMAMSIVWLIGGLVAYAFSGVVPTEALVIGFIGQLLIGSMSFLLPSRMGGGPGAVRAGMYAHNRGAYYRVVLTNLGLLAGFPVLAVASLAMFLPAQFVSRREQQAVLSGEAEKPGLARYNPWWQVAGGVLTVVAVWALTL